jgi:uncharacterized membrane-anchored protein
MFPEFTSILEFLKWIIGGTGAILIASWIFDLFPGWNNWANATAKKIIFITVSFFLAAGAYFAVMFVPASTWAAIDPLFMILMGIIVMVGGTQVVHKLTKKIRARVRG